MAKMSPQSKKFFLFAWCILIGLGLTLKLGLAIHRTQAQEEHYWWQDYQYEDNNNYNYDYNNYSEPTPVPNSLGWWGDSQNYDSNNTSYGSGGASTPVNDNNSYNYEPDPSYNPPSGGHSFTPYNDPNAYDPSRDGNANECGANGQLRTCTFEGRRENGDSGNCVSDAPDCGPGRWLSYCNGFTGPPACSLSCVCGGPAGGEPSGAGSPSNDVFIVNNVTNNNNEEPSPPPPPPPEEPSCPDPNAYRVTVASSSLLVGQTTNLYAPSGFSGGRFVSSHPAIASPNQNLLTGVSPGSALISGSGWTAPSGAVNCNLGNAAVTVNPSNGQLPPVVVLTAAPNPVNAGNPTLLSWRQIGGPADICTPLAGAGFETNGQINGQDNSAPLNTQTVFTITCTGPGGADTKSVIVAVLNPNQSGFSSYAYNTATGASSGLGVPCNKVLVAWTKIADNSVDIYKVYAVAASGGKTLVATVPVSGVTNVGADKWGVIVDPPTVSGLYSYQVYRYKGSIETPPPTNALGSPIAAVPCDTSDALTNANKDIIKIRNIPLSYSTMTGQDSNTGPAMPIIEGDTITFAINLVNGGSNPIVTPIQVDDQLTNLEALNKNRLELSDISATCTQDGQCRLENFSYDKNTGKFSLTVTPEPGQSLAPLSAEAWSVRVTLRTKAPNGRRGQVFKVCNKAWVNGHSGPLLTTPCLLVLPIGTPSLREIQ